MPTLEWLRAAFDHGYDSGNILSLQPDEIRANEEKRIGGSYREVFLRAVLPHLRPDSRVLELGPGRGSWTRAILTHLPQGELHTIDFQDVTRWLKPELYGGRLICHRVKDNAFSILKPGYFDFFWSFGVLCHCNQAHVREILLNALGKMAAGGVAVHQYADWEKLEKFGWERGEVPPDFKSMPDDEIWWPRNDQKTMSAMASDAGWLVVRPDLGLVQRDSIIHMKRPD